MQRHLNEKSWSIKQRIVTSSRSDWFIRDTHATKKFHFYSEIHNHARETMFKTLRFHVFYAVI